MSDLQGQPISNCEECGVVIPAEYVLCQQCEWQITGTVNSIPVNGEPEDEDAYQEHIAHEGRGQSNTHPDGCFYCGSSAHHSQDCQQRD